MVMTGPGKRSYDQHSPSCFGFRIQSACSFRFLRPGGGKDTLEVVQADGSLVAPEGTLLFEWTIRDRTADVTARLYRVDGVFHFWTTDAGWYRIDPAVNRIEMSPHEDEIRREQRLWGVPTALCAKNRGDFVLHAAAVEVDGSAILLAAPGRFGKTTLALAFHRHGHRVLTEDTACGGSSPHPVLFPGPTSVRLRPDMFDGHAPAGTTIIARKSDRIHLSINADRIGDGQPVRIGAVVFLRESEEDIRMERLKGSEALPDLWTLGLRFQTPLERRRSFTHFAELAAKVPVWNLYRPLKVGTLDDVVSRVVEGARQL
jgi:hypothetical protein